jgi:hypothetical protein
LTNDLRVTRILQNPLGQLAPDGERGDMVRVSDGARTLYLDPDEFDGLDERALRYLLAQKGTPAH